MVVVRACWSLILLAALALAAAPARAEGDLTVAELDLIAPPDLSSPRATLRALLDNFNEAYEVFGKAYDQHLAEPGFFASPEVEEQVQRAASLLRRARMTIDLSDIPAVNRQPIGTETVLLLGEILNRLPPFDLDTVPDAAEAAASGIASWTIPHTDLSIVRQESGPEAGRWLFAQGTAGRAEELYAAIRFYGGRLQAGKDLYRFYTLAPGDLLPPKWYTAIERLPQWARVRVLLGHSVWQWAGIAVTLLVLFGAWWLVARATIRRSRAAGRRSLPARLLLPALLIGAALLTRHVIVHPLSASGWVLAVANSVLEIVAYLGGAWLAYAFCAGTAERLAGSGRFGAGSIDASLIRVVGRVVGIAAVLAILFVGAADVGIPVYGVIAGLGVGGLALGLAARPTLENLIGGITLYADRPVRVGEVCHFADQYGIVEEIGLRSTRIRGFDRALITIPNSDFSNRVLANYSRRDHTLLSFKIGLRYGTTASQLHAVVDGIAAMLAADPEISPEYRRVHLQEFGAYAIGIAVFAYVTAPQVAAFLAVQERVLFAVMSIVEEAGAVIAVQPALIGQAESKAGLPVTGEG